MANLLNLPKVPHHVYKTTPLVLALCQIKFNSILSIADPSMVAPFQKAISERYPITSAGENVEVQLEEEHGGIQIHQGKPFRVWRFSDEEDNWTVALTHDFIALETRSYEHFDHFIEELKYILDALVKNFRPAFCVRIGLRYINEVHSEKRNWKDILNNTLLGPLVLDGFIQNVEQSVQEILLKFSDGQGVNIRHGQLPQGTTVQPKAGNLVNQLPFYLLDFDIFQEFSPRAMKMTPSLLCSSVSKYHETAYQLFRWSVTTQYVDELGERL